MLFLNLMHVGNDDPQWSALASGTDRFRRGSGVTWALWALMWSAMTLVLLLSCGPMPQEDSSEGEVAPTPKATLPRLADPRPADTPSIFPTLATPPATSTPPTSLTPSPPTPSLSPSPTATAAPTPVSTPLPDSTPVNVPTATPVPVRPVVQRVIFAVDALGREYSVMRNGNQVDSMQYRPAYEHLLAVDPVTGAFIPELATGWELLEDGRSFRFWLREDVQFHGEWGAFTGRDVVHSHGELVREDSAHPKSPYWRRLVEVVAAYENEDDGSAVDFRMARPAAEFLSAVSEQQSLIPIQSQSHFQANGEPQSTESPFIAGTGVYQLVERRAGSRILFELASDAHWRAAPDFPELEFRFQADPATRLAALLTGGAHLADVPVDRQGEAQQAGMQVARSSGPTLGLWVNLSCCWVNPETGAYPARPESPLTNPAVRKALAKSIDRQALNDAFFHGRAEIMHLNHWHPTRLGWNPAWESDFPEQYGYDPTAARALLAQAGFDENNRMETTVEPLETAALPEAVAIAEAAGAFLIAMGVEVNLLTRPAEVRRENREAMKDDNVLTIEASSADQYTGFALWGTPLVSPTNANNQPAMTDLTRRVLRTPDIKQQAELWRQLGNMAYQGHHTLPLFWLHADATYDPDVVAGYSFLGSMPGTWTHVHTIAAAW